MGKHMCWAGHIRTVVKGFDCCTSKCCCVRDGHRSFPAYINVYAVDGLHQYWYTHGQLCMFFPIYYSGNQTTSSMLPSVDASTTTSTRSFGLRSDDKKLAAKHEICCANEEATRYLQQSIKMCGKLSGQVRHIVVNCQHARV